MKVSVEISSHSRYKSTPAVVLIHFLAIKQRLRAVRQTDDSHSMDTKNRKQNLPYLSTLQKNV